MSSELVEPGEDDSIDCHLQQIGMGSLICRAAQQTGQKNTTNEVTPAVCFNCDVGKIFREVGCDAPLPKITIHDWGHGGPRVGIDGIFCKIRRRYTTLEYCHTCTLATAESTRQIVTSTRGLFQSHGFYSAYQDLEKARLAIRDGEFDRSITHSIACLESTCRIIHEELGAELPRKKGLTDLWKSTRAILDLDSLPASDTLAPLLNSLHGAVTQVGAMRNVLSDAHGRGQLPPHVSEAMAELALNSVATVATFAIRHCKSKLPEATA
jgi:hypothetical protein